MAVDHEPHRPNVLLITSDQHRGDTLGCAGHPCIQTPHLDALAYDGIRFTNAYVDCPVCIPARTTLITGIPAHIYGMPSYADSFRIQRDRAHFLGSLMTEAGYQTQLIGKTHWHTDPGFRAGFESVVPISRLYRDRLLATGRGTRHTGLGANECHPTLSSYPPELQSSDWIVDQCIEFLDERDRSQPFLLWASFIDPHPPLEIHEPYFSMYANADVPDPVIPPWIDSDEEPYALYCHRWKLNPGPMSAAAIRQARAVYYGMITSLDHQLGRLIGKLILDREWENTLVIYTSDHGENLGDRYDLAKSSFFESAANVPLIVRPPVNLELERGRVSDALIEWADLLPTLCEVADIEPPDDISGQSLWGIVRGTTNDVREYLHGHIDQSHMFYDGRLKYLYFVEDGKELLFDLQNDLQEMHNLIDDRTQLEAIRAQFVAHLQTETHPHLMEGQLLNHQRDKPPLNEIRGDMRAFGLGWTAMWVPDWKK